MWNDILQCDDTDTAIDSTTCDREPDPTPETYTHHTQISLDTAPTMTDAPGQEYLHNYSLTQSTTTSQVYRHYYDPLNHEEDLYYHPQSFHEPHHHDTHRKQVNEPQSCVGIRSHTGSFPSLEPHSYWQPTFQSAFDSFFARSVTSPDYHPHMPPPEIFSGDLHDLQLKEPNGNIVDLGSPDEASTDPNVLDTIIRTMHDKTIIYTDRDGDGFVDEITEITNSGEKSHYFLHENMWIKR